MVYCGGLIMSIIAGRPSPKIDKSKRPVPSPPPPPPKKCSCNHKTNLLYLINNAKQHICSGNIEQTKCTLEIMENFIKGY